MKTAPAKDKLKWSVDGLASLGNTIVGSVNDQPGVGWLAYGMMEEWEDTLLGYFKTGTQAKRAVTRWVRENRND